MAFCCVSPYPTHRECTYVLPNIGARRIDQISVGDTLAVLAEPWTTRPETVWVPETLPWSLTCRYAGRC